MRNEEFSPLPQRGYLWQRYWTPSVSSAVNEAEGKMDGLVILGGEIHWSEKTPSTIFPEIPWGALRNAPKPTAVAVRLESFNGGFFQNSGAREYVKNTVHAVIKAASEQGVAVSELQLDYDCASSKLDDYRGLVEELRSSIAPIPLVITTLPAWLNEPAFPSLIRAADSYVLQVHSVPTKPESGRESLCDPVLARKWVARASRIGVPFSVSLPTYHAFAGYDPSGRLLGVVMDSIQWPWPPETRILDFTANADEIADLVKEWKSERPPGMKELLWYRVPVSSDQANWRWPTLSAVMSGRKPRHQLETSISGSAPIDFAIINTGEAEENLACTLTATWREGDLIASDALSLWSIEVQKDGAVFRTAHGKRQRLLPGEKVDIGWLRFNKAPVITLNLQRGGT
jgi:hypothetical protein